jgi:hypothetical protein
MKALGLTNHDVLPLRLSSTFKQAVSLGIEPVVRHHLQCGHDVNSRDDKGQTPLIIAAAKGHTKICSILLEAGADPTLKSLAGLSALDVAINQNRSDVGELLKRLLNDEPSVSPEPKLIGPHRVVRAEC